MLFPRFTSTRSTGRSSATSPASTWTSTSRTLPARVPTPIFLTTRPDLGDVSQGKLVTIENFFEIFNGLLNPKQIEGFRPWSRPSPSSSSTDRGPAVGAGRTAVWPASTATSTATPTARRTWWATSGPGVPAPHRGRRRCAGSQHPAALRLAAGPEERRGLHGVRAEGRLLRRRSRDRHPRRGSTSWSAAARSTSWPRSRS